MRFGAAGLFVATVLLTASGVAAAVSLGFLADTPIRRFDADDLKLMNEAIQNALSASATGTPVRWSNDRTSSSGEVTAERAFDSGGRPCRDLRVVNRHRKLEASGIYTMCRQDGQWQLAQ